MSVIEFNERDLYQMATYYFDNLKYLEAIEVCDQYFNNYGIDEYLLSLKGMAFLDLNYFQSAIDTFDKLIDLNHEDLSYIYYRGLAYFKLDSFAKAIVDFKTVVKSNKSSANVNYYLAFAYYKLGNMTKATEYINRSIKIDPKKYDAFFLRGQMNFEKSLYNLARSDFSKCISLDSSDIELYLLRGNSYFMNDQRDQALRDYSMYLKAGGSNALAFIRRACCHCSKDELGKAMKDISDAVNLDGASVDVLRKRQCILGKMKKFDEAVLDLNLLFDITGDPVFIYRKTKYFVNIEKYDEALEGLNTLISLNGANRDYFMLRAKVFYYLNDYDSSLQDLDVAYKLDKQDYSSIRWKALIYNKLNNFELAIENYNLAISLCSSNIKLRVERIKYLLKFNKLDAAFEVVTHDLSGIDITEEVLPLVELACEISYMREDWKKSILYSTTYLKLNNSFNYDILKYRSLSFYNLKNYTSAIECFNKLLLMNVDESILMKLGMSYLFIERYDDSIRVLSDLIQSNKANFVAYYYRGLAYDNSQNNPLAMKDYNYVIDNSSNPLWGFFRRGNLKFKLGDYRGAVGDQTSALSIDSNFAKAYFSRGLAYLKLDKIDDGCLDLSKAGELGIIESYEIIKKCS